MAILDECPDVKDVTVEVSPRLEPGQPITVVPARYKRNEVYGIQFTGTIPSYEWVYNANPEKGRFFTEAENLHHMDVAVIGHDLAEGLFHEEDPLGKSIEVGGAFYQVVGVLEKRKGQFFKDASADKVVVVPYGAYRKHNPAGRRTLHWRASVSRQKGPGGGRNHRPDAAAQRGCASISRIISRFPVRRGLRANSVRSRERLPLPWS